MTIENEPNAIPGEGADLSADQADTDAAALWNEFEETEGGTTPAKADADDGSDKADADPDQGGADDADGSAADGTDGKAKTEDAPADPWANLTPQQRHEFQSNRGRIAAMQRQIEDLRKGAAKPAAAADKPVDYKGTDAWKALESDYPEIAEALKPALEANSARTAGIENTISTLTQRDQEAHYAEQESYVLKEHADYGAITKSPEFKGWYETAPAYVKAGIERNGANIVDGGEVAYLLNQFKRDTGWGADKSDPAKATVAKRAAQLEGSTTPKTRGSGAAKAGIPEDGDPAAIWAAFDAMDARKAKAA